MPLSIGFSGLGRMGGGMALNLARAGESLTVFDLDENTLAPLAEAGATLARSNHDLAGAVDVVFLCLPFVDEVQSALFEPDGILAGASPGLTIVDASTLNYYATLQVAERVEAAGLSYSDCPVSGLPVRASDGTLTMMFGGSASAFDIARPYLDIMGSTIIHCGALGSGQMMKAFNNVIYDININAFCELMPLAVKAGLDVEQVARVVTSGSSRSFASEYFVPRILERSFAGDFAMREAHKDIVNVEQIAARLQAATPLTDAMVSTYRQALAAGLGDEPKSAMIKLYETALGTTVGKNA